MKSLFKTVISALITVPLLLTTNSAVEAAAVSYITDKLTIPLRNKKGLKGTKVLQMLPSRSKVTVLKSSEDGYVKIRTKQGKEGWLLSRYLMDSAGDAKLLKQIQSKATALELELAKLKTENEALSQYRKTMEVKLVEMEQKSGKLLADNNQIKENYSEAIELVDKNKQLEAELLSARRQNDILQQENSTLGDPSKRNWMLVGSGIAFLGILFGLLFHKLLPARQDSWKLG